MSARFAMLLMFTLLGACGGGSGREPARHGSGLPANFEPVADARVAGPVWENTLIRLDGTSSVDHDGSITSFTWMQTAGASVVLEGATTAMASFVAPNVREDTLLTFRLTVRDDAGAEAWDEARVVVQPIRYSVSGTILPAPGSVADGDVNDRNAPRQPNDGPGDAQMLGDAVTVGGYVSLPGTGEPGALQASGDPSDFYRVSLDEGQTVLLLTADPDESDLDLYLWDAGGESVLDASVGLGAAEILTAAAAGEYLLEVTSSRGASNYTLVIGEPLIGLLGAGMRLSDDFVAGEIIFEHRSSRAPALARFEPGRGQARATDAAGAGRSRATTNLRLRHKLDTLLRVKRLQREEGIIYAQPNHRVRPQAIPDDTHYARQWNHAMVSLPAAWEQTRGEGTTVAVLDTGVLPAHPDLVGRLLPGYDFVSSESAGADGDGIDPDPTDPGDGNGEVPSSFHGTHVAGIVAAATGNGVGIAGVAPGAMILPVRVLGVGGGSSYDILQGLRYAAGLENDSGTIHPPVDVINLSLGRTGPCWRAEQAVFSAVREAGVLVVAAAGNGGVDAADAFPANCPHVVAVGALDMHGVPTPYSNFGSSVEVWAPGGRSHDSNGDGFPDGVLSLSGDDANGLVYTYAFRQGTSMASPHVAGIAALMRSAGADLTPAAFDVLLDYGRITDEAGRIDAAKAVQAARRGPEHSPVATARFYAEPDSIDFGSAYAHAQFEARSTAAELAIQDPVHGETWLRLSPLEVTQNVVRYSAVVDRAGLSPGNYFDVIRIAAADHVVEVPVSMRVSASLATDPGHLYVLLVDPVTGAVVDQTEATGRSGSHRYRFDAVDDGGYYLIAGSDRDNDLSICDAGESCGGFRTIRVDGDAEVDLSVGPTLSINGGSGRTGLEAARSAGTGAGERLARRD